MNHFRLFVPQRHIATALLLLAAASKGWAQGFDKINTTVTNVNTILVTISIAVVTIAIIWAGFKMIFQGARLTMGFLSSLFGATRTMYLTRNVG